MLFMNKTFCSYIEKNEILKNDKLKIFMPKAFQNFLISLPKNTVCARK